MESRHYSEKNKSALGRAAESALFALEPLLLQKKIKGEAEEIGENPLLGAKTNFTFIQEELGNKLSELFDCAGVLDEDSENNFRIEFNTRSLFDPLINEQGKFLILDRDGLWLCSVIGDGENDFSSEKMQKKQDLETFHKRRGEAERAIDIFGRMSTKEITLRIMYDIKSLIASDYVVPNPTPKFKHELKPTSLTIHESNPDSDSDLDLDPNSKINLILDLKDFFVDLKHRGK